MKIERGDFVVDAYGAMYLVDDVVGGLVFGDDIQRKRRPQTTQIENIVEVIAKGDVSHD
jgi:hypothetical protein